MTDVTDERLQDYLDGRLSEPERAEVEAAIDADPELARRVTGWREIGAALRSGEDELPPGFFARSRERFEQSGRHRSRFGFRLVSWEVAGLAAAVLLAAVVFVPEMMRDPELGRPPATPAPIRSEDASDSPAPMSEPPVRQEAKKVARDAVGSRGAATEPTSAFAEEVAPPRKEKEAAKQELPAEPAPEAEPAPLAEGRLSTVAAPETGKRSRGQKAAVAPVRVDTDVVGLEDRESRPSVVVELPSSGTPPEGLTVVDTRADWERWLAGPAGPALSGLGDPDPARRLVVVGRATGLDCSGLRPVRLGNRYSIRLTSGSSAGCALLLPRDGLPITLE